MKLFFGVLLYCAVGLMAQSILQTASIEGVFKDDRGYKLEGAAISVVVQSKAVDALKQSPLKSTLTDKKGHFRIDDIPAGTYTVIFKSEQSNTMVYSDVVLAAGTLKVMNVKASKPVCDLPVIRSSCDRIDTASSTSITHICNNMLERFR